MGRGIIWLLDIEDPNSIAFVIPIIQLPVTWEIDAKIIAVIIAFAFLWINYMGVASTGRAELFIVLVQLLVLGLFSIAGLLRAVEEPVASMANFNNFFPTNLENIIITMGLLFIAFEGYEICAQAGEEAKKPEQSIPRAIFLSITALVITYLFVFFVAILATGADQDSIIVIGAEKGLILGAASLVPILGPLMIVAMLFGAAATLNATIYSSSRVALALARDNNLPAQFLKIHRIRKTPWIAIWGSGVIIVSMAIFLPFNDVIASADVLFLLLFILVNYSAIVLRKRHGREVYPYKSPFFPLLPIIGLASKLILAVYLIIYSAIAWLVAGFWISGGLVFREGVKFYMKRNRN
jgi:amino acid transporter